jgi:hypothetical protein
MTTEVNGFDDNDTRRISDTVAIVLGTQSAQGSVSRQSDVQLPVIVQPVDTLRSLAKWMTSQFDVTIHTIDGDEWKDEKTASPIRLVTNGKQIALPVAGVGLCVVDSEFWAVNIGTLLPATHPLTGHRVGRAAVLELNSEGDLEITDDRLDFIRRDASGEIEDGTLITLGHVSGSLTIKWADCTSHEDLEGLEANPEPEDEE